MKWIGVDFDATLAVYYPGQGVATCGAPIPKMVERVKGWLAEKREVRIVTARVWVPHTFYGQSYVEAFQRTLQDFMDDAAEQRCKIQDWCLEHLGQKLTVQCEKDYDMAELWDDRAVGVWPNTGVPRTEFDDPHRGAAIDRVRELLDSHPTVVDRNDFYGMIVNAVLGIS